MNSMKLLSKTLYEILRKFYLLISLSVLFVHVKEFWRTNLPKSNVPEGHLCVSLDTLKLRPKT